MPTLEVHRAMSRQGIATKTITPDVYLHVVFICKRGFYSVSYVGRNLVCKFSLINIEFSLINIEDVCYEGEISFRKCWSGPHADPTISKTGGGLQCAANPTLLLAVPTERSEWPSS